MTLMVLRAHTRARHRNGMTLRITANSERMAGGAAPRWLLALVIGAVLLFVFVPGATGGAGDYPQPLYLTNAPSTNVPASHRLLASGGPGALAAPSVSVQAGSGMAIGSYTYAYTLVDSTGGETAPSVVSATAMTSSGNQQIAVSGLPATGTWRLYRKRSTFYFFVTEQTDTPSYTDSAADPPSATVLPQAQNRLASAFSSTCTATTCGWLEFVPGVAITSTTANGTPATTAPSAPTGKGWLVDDSGSVHFAPGDWTFSVQTKNGGASTSGTAHLVVGMWKVTTAGTAVGAPLVDPATAGEDTGTNLIDTTNAAKTVTHTVSNVPGFSLADDERLYVQFWRRQTVPYVNNFNNDSRIITLFAFDGVGRISHPAASTLPDTPVLELPADGASSEPGSPLLAAAFSDHDVGDSGHVDFRVCSALVGGAGSDCAGTVVNGSSGVVSSGDTASWTVAPALTHGTYWWQARAEDALGGLSDWSATRSFTVNDGPVAPTLEKPAAGAWVRRAMPTLRARFDDPDGDGGTMLFRVCKKPSAAGVKCSGRVQAGAVANVADGEIAKWAVPLALDDATYYWQAKSRDDAGARSTWTGTRRLEIAVALIRILSPTDLDCAVGSRMAIRLRLGAASTVSAHFQTEGRVDHLRTFGRLEPGVRTVRMRIPYTLERPATYWVALRATRHTESARRWLRIDLRRLFRGEVNPPPCSAG
jgi:hypothetical protein